MDKQTTLRRMFFDIAFFAKTIIPNIVYENTPEFHYEVYKAIENEANKKVAVIAPRGHSKSTIASLIYVLHRIAFNLANFIIIISESSSQSVNLLRDIKDTIEFNEKFRYYFGDLTGDSKWTESDIITANGVRVWGRGSRQRIRGSKHKGQRPDLIILDDFESEGNTETEEQRAKLKAWINASVLPAIDPAIGRVFMIGTIVHYDSYLADVARDKDGKIGWKTLFYKAITDWDKKTVLWPERYSYDYLMEIKNQYEAQGMIHLFYQEYQNEPTPPGSGIATRDEIKREQVEYQWDTSHKIWKIKEDGKWIPMFTFLGLDLSTGKLGRDRTGEVVTGVSATGKKYLLEARGLYVGAKDFINWVFELYDRWHFRSLELETVAFQEVYAQLLYEEMRKRSTYFTINEHNPRTSKSSRLLSLAPLYKSGSIVHVGEFPDLEVELLTFPKSRHDDILDALYYSLQNVYPPQMMSFEKSKDPLRDWLDEHKEYNWAVL